jgi:hypothetical protein
MSYRPSLACDHVWTHVTADAPEAKTLNDAGLRLLPTPIHHTGMGTASTGFIFNNAYLELLWIEDPHALSQAAPEFARSLLGGRGASPFGIGLRRATEDDEVPFETTTITAEWIKAGTSIQAARRAADRPLADPPIFVVPRHMAFPEFKDQVADLQVNGLGLRDVSRVRIHGPGLSSIPPPIRETLGLGSRSHSLTGPE